MTALADAPLTDRAAGLDLTQLNDAQLLAALSALPLHRQLALAQRLVAEVRDVVVEPSSIQRFESLNAHADDEQPLDWGTLWATGSSDGDDAPAAGSPCAAGAERVHPDESDDLPWLPSMVRVAEDLRRSADAVNSALAAHVDRSFSLRATRYERLGIPEKETDYTGAPAYLAELIGVSKSVARTRVKAGQHLLPRPLPGALAEVTDSAAPRYRHTGRAYTSGSVAPENAQRITTSLQEVVTYGRRCKVPQEKVNLAIASGDKFLAGQVSIGTAEEFRDLCATWVERTKALLDQDGVPPEENGKPPAHGLSYLGRNADGLHEWKMRLNDVLHELLASLTSAATNPRSLTVKERAQALDALFERYQAEVGLNGDDAPADSAADSSAAEPVAEPDVGNDETTGADSNTEPDAQSGTEDDGFRLEPGNVALDPLDPEFTPPDPWATPEQIRLNRPLREALQLEALMAAFYAGMQGLAREGNLPKNNGLLPRINAVIDYEELVRQVEGESPGSMPPPLRDRGTLFEATHTGPFSPTEILALSCDAQIIPTVMNPEKTVVLAQGRDHRLLPQAMKNALIARDGGCARPGCTAPASWCQGHHVKHWAKGGKTDLDNLVLLCPGCHRLVHHDKYSVEMVDGVAWFTPAIWLNPDPTPQRNSYHRPGNADLDPPPSWE